MDHKEGLYYPSGVEEETYPLFGWLKQERMRELINSYAEFIYEEPQWARTAGRDRVKTGYVAKKFEEKPRYWGWATLIMAISRFYLFLALE